MTGAGSMCCLVATREVKVQLFPFFVLPSDVQYAVFHRLPTESSAAPVLKNVALRHRSSFIIYLLFGFHVGSLSLVLYVFSSDRIAFRGFVECYAAARLYRRGEIQDLSHFRLDFAAVFRSGCLVLSLYGFCCGD